MDDDAKGVFDVISEEVDHVLPAADSSEEEQETKTETVEAKTAETNEEETSSESGEPASTETTTETSEPLKTETETNTEAEIDWKTTLPPPPVLAPLVEPIKDADGNITNMDSSQYEEYIVQKAENRLSQKMYANYIENAGLDAAEKILPELKTNPAVRQMVESMRIAGVVNGKNVDVVQAAKSVKELIMGSRADGAQNTKSSITIQKNAALETGAGAKKSPPSKGAKIADRINKGDEDAMLELFDVWQDEGYL